VAQGAPNLLPPRTRAAVAVCATALAALIGAPGAVGNVSTPLLEDPAGDNVDAVDLRFNMVSHEEGDAGRADDDVLTLTSFLTNTGGAQGARFFAGDRVDWYLNTDGNPSTGDGDGDDVRVRLEGTAVIWTTQRIDEIRGLADAVTLLRRGEVCFAGSVPQLMEHARLRGYLLRLGGEVDGDDLAALDAALGGLGRLERADAHASAHCVLTLADDVVLGDAIARLVAVGARVETCTEQRSALEEAFRSLTGDPEA
jgi:hypothetical protein